MRLPSTVAFPGTFVENDTHDPVTLARTMHVVPIRVEVPQGTNVDAIYLAGSAPAAGAWRPNGLSLARQADGTYAGDVALRLGSRIEFKFTRDGTWSSVERHADGHDRANRAVTVELTTRLDAVVERWE